jgi:integrase
MPKPPKILPIAAAIADATPLPDGTATRTGLTHGLERDTLRSSNATKRTRKSMSRRRGQNGHIEKSGRWYVVRFWMDVAGQEKRVHKRERICPVAGLGSMTESARERRAKEIVQQSGADTVEHFERVVLSVTGITFREQADTWYAFMSNPRRQGKNGLPTAQSTLDTWKGIVERMKKEELGDIPLSALVQDQQPVADFITKLVKDGYEAKTIKNYFGVMKMVVASAKDKSTRKPLFPVAWDNDVLLMPRVNAKKQNRPAFTDKQVSQIVERAEGQYRVLFAVLAASGLRISELLGLRIENVLDDCYRLRIIEQNYAGRQEDRLKTANAERIVELHSTAAQLLRSHIDQRTSGFVFENKKHNALCATNILKRYLHPVLLGSGDKPGVTGQKAGEHAFRRYRDGYLRTQNCPAGLLKYWLGHSRNQDMSDLYDGSVADEAYRLEMSEKMGIGFEIPLVVVPNVPSCTDETKTAAGAAAVLSARS